MSSGPAAVRTVAARSQPNFGLQQTKARVRSWQRRCTRTRNAVVNCEAVAGPRSGRAEGPGGGPSQLNPESLCCAR